MDDWQFDAFKLNEVSGGRPLSLLAFSLFKRCEMLDKFQLDEHKLVKFLMRVEDGYPTGLGSGNPYHNRIHAADVLQSLHVLVVRGGLVTHGYCDETALTSCYLSAVSECGLRGVRCWPVGVCASTPCRRRAAPVWDGWRPAACSPCHAMMGSATV